MTRGDYFFNLFFGCFIIFHRVICMAIWLNLLWMWLHVRLENESGLFEQLFFYVFLKAIIRLSLVHTHIQSVFNMWDYCSLLPTANTQLWRLGQVKTYCILHFDYFLSENKSDSFKFVLAFALLHVYYLRIIKLIIIIIICNLLGFLFRWEKNLKVYFKKKKKGAKKYF